MFQDVTLACDDNWNIQTHKIILVAGSQVEEGFKENNKHPHPLIGVRGGGTSTQWGLGPETFLGLEVETVEETKQAKNAFLLFPLLVLMCFSTAPPCWPAVLDLQLFGSSLVALPPWPFYCLTTPSPHDTWGLGG